MSKVIFARPRHEYGSYQDIYALITLSGYPLVYFDQIDPAAQDTAYILTIVNGENQAGWPGAKARIVLYDLEWRSPSEYPRLPGVSEVWAADAWYARLVGAKYVPLGSHPELGGGHMINEYADGINWDAAMLAYLSPRRQAAVGNLERAGVSLAPKGWGVERWRILSQTWALLHVHQHDDIPTVAPGRFALAAAFHMPIVTERLSDPGIFAAVNLRQADFPHLPAAVKAECDAEDFEAADALHELLCHEYTFKRCIEGAL